MKTTLAVLMLTSCFCYALHAQVDVRVGVHGGLNFATWGGNDAQAITDGDASIGAPEATTRMNAGVFAVIGHPDGMFAFQPEILYTQKGTKQQGSFDFFGQKFNLVATAQVDYIEAPMLARLNLSPGSTAITKAYLVAGPALAFRVNTSAVAELNGTEVSSSEVDDSQMNAIDLGAVIGAGLDIQFPFATLVVDLRYNLGLTTMDKDGNADIKNRVLSVNIGLMLW